MINPLKLMPGDWVWSLKCNDYYQIEPESYFRSNSDGYITPHRIEGLDLEPISLTENILDKYDVFKYTPLNKYYFRRETRCKISHYEIIEHALNSYLREYAYLHEFQQLLRSLGQHELANKNIFKTSK